MNHPLWEVGKSRNLPTYHTRELRRDVGAPRPEKCGLRRRGRCPHLDLLMWVMGKGANLPTYLSRRRTRAARVPLTINRRHLVIKRPHKR